MTGVGRLGVREQLVHKWSRGRVVLLIRRKKNRRSPPSVGVGPPLARQAQPSNTVMLAVQQVTNTDANGLVETSSDDVILH